MRSVLVLATAAVMAACSAQNPVSPSAPARAAVSMPAPQVPLLCDPELWEPVYSKDRLTVLNPCERESGIVTAVSLEHDGDLTIHIVPRTARLLGPGNVYLDNQGCGAPGCLQIEVPCQGSIVQADAIGTCRAFRGHTVVPPRVGDAIEAAGPYVEDHRHHNWHELHGATFRITPAPASAAPR